jgi:hypothetical protein
LAGPGGSLRASPLSAALLEKLWADLAGRDAAVARAALWRLAAAPGQAVPWLQARLRPAEAPDPRRLERLLADLDSDRFAEREKAAGEIAGLGDLAEPALRKALEGPLSAEARRRARQLREALAGPVRAPEELRAVRAVQVLEEVGTTQARRLLQALGEGAAGARLTREAKAALDRLGTRAR